MGSAVVGPVSRVSALHPTEAAPQARSEEESSRVYAIVRCGGRQEKASVADVLTVDKLAGEAGSTVTLPALLVVDDENVVSDPAEVGRYTVTAEILGTVSGPKINMIHYRNKTGYKRRLGHRQKHTQLKITDIAPEGGGSSRSASSRSRASASTDKKPAAQSGATAERGGTSRAGTSRAGGSRAGTSRAGGSRGGSGSGGSGSGGSSGVGSGGAGSRGGSRSGAGSRTASGGSGTSKAGTAQSGSAQSGSGSGTRSRRSGSGSGSGTSASGEQES
jgi:large subunit ribosomal protein L21